MREHLHTASGAPEIILNARLLYESGRYLESNSFHFCFSERFYPPAAAPVSHPQRGLEGRQLARDAVKTFMPQKALSKSAPVKAPEETQLGLHLAQRKKNKSLTFLEFGLCLVISPCPSVIILFSQ